MRYSKQKLKTTQVLAPTFPGRGIVVPEALFRASCKGRGFLAIPRS